MKMVNSNKISLPRPSAQWVSPLNNWVGSSPIKIYQKMYCSLCIPILHMITCIFLGRVLKTLIDGRFMIFGATWLNHLQRLKIIKSKELKFAIWYRACILSLFEIGRPINCIQSDFLRFEIISSKLPFLKT